MGVLDMQHEIAGFQRAFVGHAAEELANFPLLATIADGLTWMEEIQQFEVIDTTHEKVQTDPAHNLLAAQRLQDGIATLERRSTSAQPSRRARLSLAPRRDCGNEPGRAEEPSASLLNQGRQGALR